MTIKLQTPNCISASLVPWTSRRAEINLGVLNSLRLPEVCRKKYSNMLAQWREAGVKFTFGTDQHAAHYDPAVIAASELLLDFYGFKDEDVKYLFD